MDSSAPRQRTIARPAQVRGFGLFGGQDCTLRLLPAPENAGISFQRVDMPSTRPIPATIDRIVPRLRRTAISNGAAHVEMIEHVMAALAGLWIDNCLVELDAPEPPVGDGSSIAFVEAIMAAGIVEQTATAKVLSAGLTQTATEATSEGEIRIAPADRCIIAYDLNYRNSPLLPHSVSLTICPESFATEIAFARTFVMATEIEGLRRQGYGKRVTSQNVLVVEDNGVVRDNKFHRPDECARHKILDAIGDFALCGARVTGSFHGIRSGHHHNHLVAEALKEHGRSSGGQTLGRAA
jgi:UDP-3-O-acyl N-acetylglucosamine deacetylase